MTKNIAKLFFVPEVSIILPVYNAERYISEAIESILQQTFTDFELIIINDGSTDGSAEIIKKNSLLDQRIIFYSRENQGLVATLNEAISIAKGKYIARMDSDDISSPDRIRMQFEHLHAFPELDLISCAFVPFKANELQEPIKHPTNPLLIQLLLSFCSPICHPAVFARSEVLKNFKYRSDVAAEDHELWCRISSAYVIGNQSHVLLRYRLHDESITANNKKIIRRSTIKFGALHFIKHYKKFATLTFSELKANKDCRSINWNMAYAILFIAKFFTKIT